MKRGMRVGFKLCGMWRYHYITDIWIENGNIVIEKKNGEIVRYNVYNVDEIKTPKKIGIWGTPTFVKVSDLAFLLRNGFY